jgi:hypothetical protein
VFSYSVYHRLPLCIGLFIVYNFGYIVRTHIIDLLLVVSNDVGPLYLSAICNLYIVVVELYMVVVELGLGPQQETY